MVDKSHTSQPFIKNVSAPTVALQCSSALIPVMDPCCVPSHSTCNLIFSMYCPLSISLQCCWMHSVCSLLPLLSLLIIWFLLPLCPPPALLLPPLLLFLFIFCEWSHNLCSQTHKGLRKVWVETTGGHGSRRQRNCSTQIFPVISCAEGQECGGSGCYQHKSDNWDTGRMCSQLKCKRRKLTTLG